MLVSPFFLFPFCVRPLSSEWPLWSEVGTILPLKLWHSVRKLPRRKERSFSSSCSVASLPPPLSLQGAYSGRRTSPPVLTFWHPVCCFARSLEIRGLNHHQGLCVCVHECGVCVAGGQLSCATVMPLKQVRVFHRCPILAEPWRTIGKQQPARGISVSVSFPLSLS